MTAATVEEHVRDIVAAVFEVPIDQVKPETSAGDLDQWNSLGQLVLILELEREFGVTWPPEDGEKLTSVRTIVEMLYGSGGLARGDLGGRTVD